MPLVGSGAAEFRRRGARARTRRAARAAAAGGPRRLAAALAAGRAKRPRRPCALARSARSANPISLAAETLLADLKARARAAARALGDAPLVDFIAAHRAALAALAAPRDLAAAPDGEALEALFEEWALAAERRLRRQPRRLRRAVRTLVAASARAARARAAIRASRFSASSKRGCSSFDLDAARRARRDGVAAGRRDRRVPQPADARRARPFRAGAAHRPDRARFRRRARRARRHPVAREKARRLADRRLALPAAARRGRGRGGNGGDGAARRALARPRAPARPARDQAARSSARSRGRRSSCGRTKLSVTRIEALRRDPYAIYAERILGLLPLPPDRRRRGAARDRHVWHAALGRVRRRRAPPNESAGGGARAAYVAARARVRARSTPTPRFARCAGRASCKGSRSSWPSTPSGAREASALCFELDGALDIELAGAPTFTLTARADRIETLRRRRRGDHRLQDRRAAGRQGGDRRLRAAADAGSRDARARRLCEGRPQPRPRR